MKTKSNKSLMFLLVLAILCFACSLFVAVPFSNTAYASNTSSFAMIDGAGIRLKNEENAPMGIRFCVQVDASAKSAIIDAEEFGFIISRADQFEGVTEYVDMAKKSQWSVDITDENFGEYFYEHVENNNTFYRANAVIYKSAADNTNDFITRVYSAVAYYIDADSANPVYAADIPARSVQQVASDIYFNDPALFEGVQATYTAIGTDVAPVLVGQDGYNSYANLKEKVASSDVSGITFALEENVVVEEKLEEGAATFIGEKYDVYTVDEFYTVNHLVTSVYSANTAVALDGKVTSATEQAVEYTVEDASGADVAVEDNAFTPTAAGKYTVTAKVGDYIGKTFTVEVANNAYADGLILDGTSAEDIAISYENNSYSEVEGLVSFDANKTYDSASNGSYKVEYKIKEGVEALTTGPVALNIGVKPAFSSEYYQALKDAGYNQIAVRMYLDVFEYTGTVRMFYVEDGVASNMYIYHGNEAIVKRESQKVFWGNNIDPAVGKWTELVLDIQKFIDNYDEAVDVVVLSVNKNSHLNAVMYIDNVYAVKGLASAETTAQYVNSGTEIDCTATFASIPNAIASVDLDGKAVAVSDNKFTADGYGLYTVKALSRTLYGSANQNVIVNGSVVSYQANNFYAKHIINATSAATDYTATVADDKIAVSSNGAGKVSGVSMTTYKIDTLGDKAYYEALKAAEYNYITYEYTFMCTGTIPSVTMYRFALVTKDTGHSNNFSAGTSSFSYLYKEEGASAATDTNEKTSGNKTLVSGSASSWNNKKYIISIPIQTFIDNYSSTMRILALYFGAAAAELDYTVTFGNVRATASACVFDTPQVAE